MKSKSTVIRHAVRAIACITIFLCVCAAKPAMAIILFSDDFDGSQADSWQNLTEPGPDQNYITLDTDTYLRMTSIMWDNEWRGIGTKTKFNFSQGQIIAGFRTMPFSDSSVPAENQQNIDGLLAFRLYSNTAPSMELIVMGTNFGEERTVLILGDGVNEQSTIGIWDYEQEYRIVITSQEESTNVSFQNADEQELFGYTFGFDLGTLGDFNIHMTQWMGTPDGQYYSDIAMNSLSVSSDQGYTTLRQTNYGQVSGIEDTANTWAWLGIPYAKPPEETLRWKESQNPDTWEGVKETTAFCSECPQYAGDCTIVGNEDCLYLNIWRPRTQDTDLPVYFWIHGGGNSAGAADLEQYHGANLADQSNMVVVTINYRLGPLGWFTYPALRTGLLGDEKSDSGNFGTLDMIKALQWVNENIHYFGGDPDNVTIAGESAGAYNVLSLLISPLSTGLFHKAIMQSGGQYTNSVAQGEAHANDVIIQIMINDGTAANETQAQAILNTWTHGEIQTYLRGKTAQQILEAYTPSSLNMIEFSKLFTDGTVLPLNGLDTLDDGTYPNKVPVILGSNLEELKVFLRYHPYFITMINDGSFWNAEHDQDRALYASSSYYGSGFWKVDAVDEVARKLKSHVDQPNVYAYRFDWGSGAEVGASAPGWYTQLLGASHTLEIPFFFGNQTGGLANVIFNEDNRPGREALSAAMMAYLANFARTGDPNDTGLPVWSPWSNGEGEAKHIILDVDDVTQVPTLSMSTVELTKSGVESDMAGSPLCEDIQNIFENGYPFTFLSWNVPCIPPCECDLNTDGKCDMQDWLKFGEDWGRTDCNEPGVDCECDLNTDGKCDMQDWLKFGEDWGRTDCPTP